MQDLTPGAMEPGRAIALGVLQGLGEFLPISSSGHLIVVPWLLGWPDHGLAFDVALHIGTLLAVVYAFAADWWRLLGGALRGLRQGRPFAAPEGRLLGLLALASIPGAVAGLLLDDWAETVFRSPALVACTLAGMGAVLFVADARASGGRGEVATISTRDALLIGLSQAAAIVPGVSRSGVTISMGLLLGYRREEAARFSFLLATPITLGAALVKAPDLIGAAQPGVLLAGMLAAAIVGLLSIRVLLAYVRTRDYRPFVYYRFALAALVLLALLVRRGGLG
jgi:undecaprenyl-diphosphatase